MSSVAGTNSGRLSPIKFASMLAISSEFMIFAGMISSWVIFRADNVDWPPIGQPRLPVETTALNTVLLLLSALPCYMGVKAASKNETPASLLGVTAVLGLLFLLLQGREWAALLARGMGVQNNPFGAFFYLIVGLHALHVLVAVGLAVNVYLRASSGSYHPGNLEGLEAFSYFWYFVVFLWPPLYYLVYLW